MAKLDSRDIAALERVLLARRATLGAGDLEAVELALGRVADGSYGRCAGCGADIPLPRLRAQPAAALCLACQQESERHYRVPTLFKA
jgi:RNA polymerase-binding transcription factor DksA